MPHDSSQTRRKYGIDRRRDYSAESRASPGSTAPTVGGGTPEKLEDFDIDPKLHDLPVITHPVADRLSQRQLVDYKIHREKLLLWMLEIGKDPSKGEGYAWETVKRRSYNVDMFYRWVWSELDRYTTQVTTSDADNYLRELARTDSAPSNKENIEKSIKMLFRWRTDELGEDWSDWEPAISFAESRGPQQPRDYITREERPLLREAALEYGSVPHYNAVTPEERREWKIYLSKRFRKPIDEVDKQDFERANGYKIPSLVWTSLDAGLRPREVATARLSWVDTENAVLRIPYAESVKNEGNWHVSIREQTAEYLRRWKEERQLYDKYDDTDLLWLTRENNPYRSTALTYVLHKLCDIAGIDTEDRQMSWYSIRHSVGTYMTREEGLKAAKAQLRHVRIETTSKYDQAPIEDRRAALERMG